MSKPSITLAAQPAEPTEVVGIFESSSEVRGLLEKPGGLRYAGWDLETLDQAKIVRGEFLEVGTKEYKRIQVHSNGALVARFVADGQFLGHSASDEAAFAAKPRLNPLAVIECIANFVDFYRRLLKFHREAVGSHHFVMAIRDTKVGENRLYMNPFGVNTWARLMDRTQYPAPEDNAELALTIDRDTITHGPARAAYLLVERLYLWFGVPTNEIPYVIESNSMKMLDLEKIKQGGADPK
jgi:hypothetical protein